MKGFPFAGRRNIQSMAGKRSKFERKLDGFFRGLFFEENGKPKSASLLYSFLMAILFILIYGASYLLLLDPLEKALAGTSVLLRNLAEYLVPALAGSALCLLFTLLPGEKRGLAAGAYLWMAALLIAVMLFELLLIDWSDARTEYGLFIAVVNLPGIASVLTGGVPALLLYRRERKARAEREKVRERPSWYQS